MCCYILKSISFLLVLSGKDFVFWSDSRNRKMFYQCKQKKKRNEKRKDGKESISEAFELFERQTTCEKPVRTSTNIPFNSIPFNIQTGQRLSYHYFSRQITQHGGNFIFFYFFFFGRSRNILKIATLNILLRLTITSPYQFPYTYLYIQES